MVRRAFLLMLVAGCLLGPIRRAATDDATPKNDADACAPDVHRLCDDVFPDEKLVATCLVDKRAQLSVACAEVLARPPAPDGADAN